MKFLRLITIVFFICSLFTQAHASVVPESAKRSFSLDEAITIAENRNLDVLLYKAQTLEANGAAKTALSKLLPQVSGLVSGFRKQRSTATIGLTDELPIAVPETIGPDYLYDYRVQGRTPLVNLQAYEQWKAALADKGLRENKLASVREQVGTLTATLYLESLRNKASFELAEANIDWAASLLELAQDKENAGTGTYIDVKRSEVRLSIAQEQLETVRLELSRSLLKLAQILGIGLDVSLELTDNLVLTPIEQMNFEEALRLALNKHPDIKVKSQQELVLQHRKKAAIYDWFPVIEAVGDYGANGQKITDTGEVWYFGAEFTFPLWDSFKRQGNFEVSKSQLTQAQNRTLELKRAVETEIRITMKELESRLHHVKVTQKTVKLAESELQLADDRYEAGVGTNMEVINAQTQLTEAKFREINDLYEYNLTRLNWFKILGDVRQAVQ